jgi:hypothetical protein
MCQKLRKTSAKPEPNMARVHDDSTNSFIFAMKNKFSPVFMIAWK